MTKNPIVSALLASLYIFIVASILFYGQRLIAPQPDYVLMPAAMISLFTLSAAVMGYFFFYQPFQLYFDGKKKEAARHFLQTVGSFAIITIIIFGILISAR